MPRDTLAATKLVYHIPIQLKKLLNLFVNTQNTPNDYFLA